MLAGECATDAVLDGAGDGSEALRRVSGWARFLGPCSRGSRSQSPPKQHQRARGLVVWLSSLSWLLLFVFRLMALTSNAGRQTLFIVSWCVVFRPTLHWSFLPGTSFRDLSVNFNPVLGRQEEALAGLAWLAFAGGCLAVWMALFHSVSLGILAFGRSGGGRK